MSPALNLLSNNLQVYGPSSLPCLGVSGRAVSISPCPRSEHRTLDMSVMSPKCYLRHKSFVCKARFGGQRRDSDFSRQNRHAFSRSWARRNEERDDSDDLGESEYLSAKNEQLPSLSNSEKHSDIAVLRLIRKILESRRNSQLRGRAAVKGEKRSEAGKEQNEEIEKIYSLVRLLEEKTLVELKVNRGSSNELDEKSGETHSEPDLGAEAESDFELDMDLSSGLELEQEEDEEEELEAAMQSETDPVNGHTAEFSAAEEDNVDES